jgi:hypothetical protein
MAQVILASVEMAGKAIRVVAEILAAAVAVAVWARLERRPVLEAMTQPEPVELEEVVRTTVHLAYTVLVEVELLLGQMLAVLVVMEAAAEEAGQ